MAGQRHQSEALMAPQVERCLAHSQPQPLRCKSMAIIWVIYVLDIIRQTDGQVQITGKPPFCINDSLIKFKIYIGKKVTQKN